MVQGYNDWLTPARLVEIEAEWEAMDRSHVLQKVVDFEPKTVIEFCCGTGWIPLGLGLDVEYIGIDANPHCLALARQKNPTRKFLQMNLLEDFVVQPLQDMAVAFSCLKHFTLAAWDEVYGTVLDAGKATLCSVYLAPSDREDPGFDFPHTAVSREHMYRVVEEHGHEVLDVLTMPPLVGPKEPLVLTKRKAGSTRWAPGTSDPEFML